MLHPASTGAFPNIQRRQRDNYKESSAHRRLRRSRTRSRTLLRNCSAGLQVPQEQVERAIGVLVDHLSNSGLPQQALCIMNQGSMSWYCTHCKQWCKSTAVYCGSCGAHWTTVQGQPAPWNSAGWIQRSESPRRRNSPRRRQQNWGDAAQRNWSNHGGGGKGGSGAWQGPKGKGKAQPPTYQGPTWESPTPPWLSPGSAASQIANAGTPSASDGVQVQELVGALKSAYANAAMPPEIAEMVAKAEGCATKQQTKDLHYCTSQLGAARKQLQSVRATMLSQEAAWATFLQNTAEAVEKGSWTMQREWKNTGPKRKKPFRRLQLPGGRSGC